MAREVGMVQPQLVVRAAVEVGLRAVVGGLSLGMATEATTAVEELLLRERGPLVAAAVRAARLVGPAGVGAVLCCAGLAVAFLSMAAGLALGAGVMTLTAEAGWRPATAQGSAGVAVALGAVATGAGLGAAVSRVTGGGLFGVLCMTLMSMETAFHFAMRGRRQTRDRLTRAKLFLSLVFITMYMGVLLGLVEADTMAEIEGVVLGPVLGLAVASMVLVPMSARLGDLANQALGTLPGHSWRARAFLGRTFGSLVALVGFLLGMGSGPRWRTSFATILRSLALVVLLSAGMAGSVLGTVTEGLASGARAEGMLVWVGVVMCAMLIALNATLTSLAAALGAGGAAGALLGATGAAGLSLGAVGVAAGARFGPRGIALAVLGAVGGAVLGVARKSMRAAAITLVAASGPRIAGLEAVVRIYCEATGRAEGVLGLAKDAVIGCAALGSTALGSAVVGGVVLWIAALGSAAHLGVLAASILTLIMNFERFAL